MPVLCMEYERHGYTAHIQMFNSKYWGVPQNRERYAVIGTRNKLGLSFKFPEEQHDFVPKLSDFLEKDVPEKYYLSDEKAQTIIQQSLELSRNKKGKRAKRGKKVKQELIELYCCKMIQYIVLYKDTDTIYCV